MKKKLSLDKLVLGSLTEAQQKEVLGGKLDASSVIVNGSCVSPPPPPAPSLAGPCTSQGPPTCAAPPTTKTMTAAPCA